MQLSIDSSVWATVDMVFPEPEISDRSPLEIRQEMEAAGAGESEISAYIEASQRGFVSEDPEGDQLSWSANSVVFVGSETWEAANADPSADLSGSEAYEYEIGPFSVKRDLSGSVDTGIRIGLEGDDWGLGFSSGGPRGPGVSRPLYLEDDRGYLLYTLPATTTSVSSPADEVVAAIRDQVAGATLVLVADGDGDGEATIEWSTSDGTDNATTTTSPVSAEVND